MIDLADTPVEKTASLTTTQQIRDLLPFLDAIDTSGKTLHGIVDNILSFLDLKGKDSMLSQSSPSLLNSPSGVTQSIEVMFEELIYDACEEDKRSRRANGQPASHVETVFEIIPPLLGEKVTEDAGGALRRALSKILSNAYKFIEGHGCVEIYVDDVPSLLPPEGCEDVRIIPRLRG
jgi:signal transduction histidine kinase